MSCLSLFSDVKSSFLLRIAASSQFFFAQVGEHRQGAGRDGAGRGAVRPGAAAPLPPPLLPPDQGDRQLTRHKIWKRSFTV